MAEKDAADYFVQMQKNNDYKPEPLEMCHVQETLQLLSMMIHDLKYWIFNARYNLQRGNMSS